MSIHAALYHLTHYRYEKPVTLGPQIIRLNPAPHTKTKVLSHSLKVEPANHFVNVQQDLYANYAARFVFPEPVTELKIEVDLVADMAVYNPFDFFVEPDAKQWPFRYSEDIEQDLSIYLHTEPTGSLLTEFVADLMTLSSRQSWETVDFIVALNAKVTEHVDYIVRMEAGVQSPEQTLAVGSGSCRDSSWLLVQVCRQIGLAARFVSGYLIQLKPDLVSLDGPAGTKHDFCDLHAWCEVYLPGAGWIGLDPTSGLLVGESHIPLAATPHYRHAAPISGLVSDAPVDFSFDMTVQRVSEEPRVSQPFNDASWSALDQLGQSIDRKLSAQDMRLTMGGEPTFVSIDDYESPEWTTDATGPTKRARADRLIRSLREEFAPGGLIHYGQGKWYPGETLPRWTFSLYWRKDGDPLWSSSDLIAAEPTTATSEKAPQSQDRAEAFIRGFATTLGVGEQTIVAAYEDPAQWIVKESQLPINVDPSDSRLEDPEERARMSRVFDRGLSTPVGFVLPLQRWQAQSLSGHWQTEYWQTRRGHLFLTPGDAPIGYRLPLGELPHIDATNFPYVIQEDPSVVKGPLPSRAVHSPERSAALARTQIERRSEDPGRRRQVLNEQSSEEIIGQVRTSLTVEDRNGVLCVFMPPVSTFEDYLELLWAVQTTAKHFNQPIQVEGYAPPGDPRINVLRVAPDPGVLEVNVQPASCWDECVSITSSVYELARQQRLAADKFLIDGRQTGTGGGNHIVIGGADLNDSPFLRRPDLLKSLIVYIQRHPSLSYLFSGLFIGPTSQAPRIDEARHDSLYELETALSFVPGANDETRPTPWMIDRLLRDLLVDVSGNTHRAEICIDKLFSPDGPTGRLGLVELRGFEMPPHPRMSLAQQLLIRGLLSYLWDNPQPGRLVRFGTALHDRFMLPWHVWQDFLTVLSDLNAANMDFRSEWFEAQFAFRFPLYGEIEHGGVHLELRQALEPWHVTGEEGAIGGTVRFVDSSVERLQVKVTAADSQRYQVLCNGRLLPLGATGQTDTRVAGVRFKAWQPRTGMHPTIAVDAPLTFDIYDSVHQRSIGGCTYHVAHPAGRNYETYPVNANEAQARRLSRFQPNGHTPGHLELHRESGNFEFPMTLDLRRPPNP